MKSKCCNKEMKYFDATGIERWYECTCGKHYNADDAETDTVKGNAFRSICPTCLSLREGIGHDPYSRFCEKCKPKEQTEEWIPKDRDWSEYPIGTKAKCITGGHWIRNKSGWKWFCGDTFPTPGGDATGDIMLPLNFLPKDQKSENVEVYLSSRVKDRELQIVEKLKSIAETAIGSHQQVKNLQVIIDHLIEEITKDHE